MAAGSPSTGKETAGKEREDGSTFSCCSCLPSVGMQTPLSLHRISLYRSVVKSHAYIEEIQASGVFCLKIVLK